MNSRYSCAPSSLKANHKDDHEAWGECRSASLAACCQIAAAVSFSSISTKHLKVA